VDVGVALPNAVPGTSGEAAKAAWREAGRDDEPHLMALAYFSLGERAEQDAPR